MYRGFHLPGCLGDGSKLTWSGSCGVATNRCQTVHGHTKGGGHSVPPQWLRAK